MKTRKKILKEGMQLTIRKGLNENMNLEFGVNTAMAKMAGRKVTVREVDASELAIYLEDDYEWMWCKEMFAERDRIKFYKSYIPDSLEVASLKYPIVFHPNTMKVGCQEITRKDASKIRDAITKWLKKGKK